MLFNSLPFAVFLPIVFALYWRLNATRICWQNLSLLLASYFFYGWWDIRFLSLIIVSSVVDYLVGLRLENENDELKRKLLLAVSVFANLGILGFFKYAGFFVDSFATVLNGLGLRADLPVLHIILPVGISFYTFQTMSYTIDIYRRQFSATRDFIAFCAYVSFFPQLVAGPIERARNLLPQFLKPRTFNAEIARQAVRQILWGLFKKIVIADNAAGQVEYVFANYHMLSSIALVIGVFLFAFQIYCDFSGYSDIAIGTASLFGFKLRKNFNFPYFSRDIAEFWRRWHISLSTWFRDYVYIPLGGNRLGRRRTIVNLIVTFGVSGLWHGANWTFVFWGLLNGLYYLPLMIAGKQKQHRNIVAESRMLPDPKEMLQVLLTFSLVLFAWIFFRAQSLKHATDFIAAIGHNLYFDIPAGKMLVALLFALILAGIEWFQRKREHGLDISHLPVYLRWMVYLAIFNAILILGNFGQVEFIYFQF